MMQEKTIIKMFSTGQASDDMSSEEKLLYVLGIASKEILPVTLDVKFTKEIFCAAFIITDGEIAPLLSYVACSDQKSLRQYASYTIAICEKYNVEVDTDYLGSLASGVTTGLADSQEIRCALEMYNEDVYDYSDFQITLYAVSHPDKIKELPQFNDCSSEILLLCSDKIAHKVYRHTHFADSTTIENTISKLARCGVNPYLRFRGATVSTVPQELVERFPECAVLKKDPTDYEIGLALLNNRTSALYFSDLSQEQLKLAEFSRVNLDDADYQDELRYNSFITRNLHDACYYTTGTVPGALYRSWLRFRLNTNDYAVSKDIIRQAHRYLGEQSIYEVVKKDYRLATAIDVASPDLLDLALRSFWSSCNGVMDQEFRAWYTRQSHSTDRLATMQLF